MTAEFRVERDSMGELKVPANALWGAQTQRAVNNFPISGLPMPPAFVRALGLVKWAAADANRSLRLLPAPIAKAIQGAALEIASGKHLDQFPIDVFQTGSGTSSNMNANEVIAKLASKALGKPVHANDHVNMCQSSNDVIPSTIHVSAALEIARATAARARAPAEDDRQKGQERRGHREDRPHAPDGRDAGAARSGARRLVRPDPEQHLSAQGVAAAAHRPHAGRHRRRHGYQCAPGVLREVLRRAREAHRASASIRSTTSSRP